MFELSAFIIVELSFISLAAFAFRTPKNETNSLFAKFYSSIAIWVIVNYLENEFVSLKLSAFLLRLDFATAPFIFYYYLLFCKNFPVAGEIKIKERVSIIAPLIILSIFSFSELVIKDIYFANKGIQFKGGVLFIIYAALLFSYAAAGSINLIFKVKTYKGILRTQLYYVLSGISISAFFALVINLVLTQFFVLPTTISRLGIDGLVISAFFTAYAIFKYRLMDIKVVITRATIFVMVYIFVSGIPLLLGYRYGLWELATWAMLFLATSGPFIYSYLRRKTEKRLLAEDFKKYDTLMRFSRTLGLVRDLDKLLKLIAYRLVKTLKVNYGAIYLLDEESESYVLRSSRRSEGFQEPEVSGISNDNEFVRFLHIWKKECLSEDIQKLAHEQGREDIHRNKVNFPKVTEQMEEFDASLVIPQFLENDLIGFLILGHKLSGKAYTVTDIEVLSTLSRSAALAIMNAIFTIDLKNTESELAEAHRVAQLGYLASATGHQISNVLNNIAAVASGLLENDTIVNSLKSSPEAYPTMEKHIQDIFTNVQDGGMIIAELRDYAKSERDKKFAPVNLKEVLDRTLKVLYIQANKFQTIEIKINVSDDLPQIMGSFVSLQNVFVNMLNNAYDAILEKRAGQADYKGKIEINISRVKGDIHIHIIDDGKGIPPDVLKRLFTPLYTTKASSDKRKEQKLTGGTGIGLYTILVIIRNHGGSIKVDKTEPLKGTDFLIKLPVSREV